MSVTRRSFLRGTAYLCGGAAVTRTAHPMLPWINPESSDLDPFLTGLRMAGTPATAYRAYRSKAVTHPELPTWVQIDLGKSLPIDVIQLFPASERMYPGRDEYYAGEGFPLRFRIEASRDAEFASPLMIADFTNVDFPDPKDNITQYHAIGIEGRYVRVTATRLRVVNAGSVIGGEAPLGGEFSPSPDFTLTLAKISVLSGGRDVAVGCSTSADAEHGNPTLVAQLTRPPRQDGEGIKFDHPGAVTDPSTWNPPQLKVRVPRTGVTLNGGIFESAMSNNIEYLLNTCPLDAVLRQFYERTGKIKGFKPTGQQGFWEEDLAGSNAGRFLMGAANTLRWMDNSELRSRMNAVIDGIEECRQPNGYIMAYPENTIFYSERAAYTRAWLTHGLLEASYSGNSKALPLLRGYYDWFNVQSFLPEMLRGAVQGGQGMVANTRMGSSSLGKPADAQVIQRYYQEDAWLHGLANRQKEQIWQYPYDRPHCYLLTNLEAYLDMYLITGAQLYHDAVMGAWELYRAHWQQSGGSISIIEFENLPPDSNSLHTKLGELCGSSFWVFLNQRFLQLYPDEERFAAEIEKSIYNVGLANQEGNAGLRYHTILAGRKEKGTHDNTCCEGQGTRLLGSLPEHIYSIAPDGLYLHLFEASSIHLQLNGSEITVRMKTGFPFTNEVQVLVETQAPVHANLRIRVPSWSSDPMRIHVNGKDAGTGNAGSYVSLKRMWSNGDSIHFTLTPSIRVTPYTGEDQLPGKTRYSIEYGPILLV